MATGGTGDVQTSLMRELTATERRYVNDLLERAERLLLTRIPDLDVRCRSHDFAQLVGDVEGEAVARVFRAPDNGVLRSESENGYSYSLNLQVASGLLDILDEEWAKLGLGSISSIAPETDAYAKNQFTDRPDLQFQYGWPGQTLHCERQGNW